MSRNWKYHHLSKMKNGGIKIGGRLRALRQKLGCTLDDVARETGCSVSLLSKLENDKAFPSAGMLIRIAKTLGTSIQTILEEEEGKSSPEVVLTPREKSEGNLIKTERGFGIFPYAGDQNDSKFQVFLYSVKKGDVRAHSEAHDGWEFLFMIEGTLCVRIEDIKYTLKTGDTISFNSNSSHECIPLSDSAKYLIVFA